MAAACTLGAQEGEPVSARTIVEAVGTVGTIGFAGDTAELIDGESALRSVAVGLRAEPWTLVIHPVCDPMQCDEVLAQRRADVLAKALVAYGARSVLTHPSAGEVLAQRETGDGWLTVEIMG